jgi:hypothetical protein
MAQLGSNTGTQLTNDIANYLTQQRQAANGAIDTTQLATIINNYLTTGEKLVMETGVTTNSVYKAFNTTDIVTAKNEIVTTGIWSNGSGSLTDFYTSSTAAVAGGSGSATDEYYYNVYGSSNTGSSAVEFAVSYGHKTGGGAKSVGEDDNSTLPTKATYAQYRALLTDTNETSFRFYSGSTEDAYSSDDIYIINLSRANYRERMDAGNWQLSLSGSKGEVTFIDNSNEKFNTTNSGTNEFNIVQGSLNLGTNITASIQSYTASNGQGFGKFYPDYGVLILNPTALSASVGGELAGATALETGSYMFKHKNLYNAMSGGFSASVYIGGDFEARRIENVSTAHYFVRVNNREFNYSNNPTFVTGSQGDFYNAAFTTDPVVYPTTIGLFNDSNELIAVAKTSKPIAKSFSKEVLVKVKLDF